MTSPKNPTARVPRTTAACRVAPATHAWLQGLRPPGRSLAATSGAVLDALHAEHGRHVRDGLARCVARLRTERAPGSAEASGQGKARPQASATVLQPTARWLRSLVRPGLKLGRVTGRLLDAAHAELEGEEAGAVSRVVAEARSGAAPVERDDAALWAIHRELVRIAGEIRPWLPPDRHLPQQVSRALHGVYVHLAEIAVRVARLKTAGAPAVPREEAG